MSPASSGALEVERYIGACLISSQARSKGNNLSKCHLQDQFFQRDYSQRYANNNKQLQQQCRSADGWAGGMPLISFANYQRRKVPQQDPRNWSRLAVHTQGAPLILTNRYNHRKNKNVNRNFVHNRSATSAGGGGGGKSQGVDTVSVNSDESSTSTNSETSLPRIIKPRKRRKKDRKHPHLARPLGGDDCFSTDSASPDIDSPTLHGNINPYLPFNFDAYFTPSCNDHQETPQLHHSFEDVEELSKDINDNTSSCQCRYCDPCGQIWDVDRNCYSPFLTTPERQYTFNFPDIQVKNYESSLSTDFLDTLANLSLNNEQSPGRDLEVSTEIVTSHNGHRDLEIKFFSSDAKKINSRPCDKFSCDKEMSEFFVTKKLAFDL